MKAEGTLRKQSGLVLGRYFSGNSHGARPPKSLLENQKRRTRTRESHNSSRGQARDRKWSLPDANLHGCTG